MYDTNDFQAVDMGNTSEVPPEAPPGEWLSIASAKPRKNGKTGRPMLIIDLTLDKALTDGNETFVGARVSAFINCIPKNEDPRQHRMNIETLHAVCAAADVPVPEDFGRTPESLQDLADALEGKRIRHTTYVNKKGYLNVGFGRPSRAVATPAETAHDTEPPADEAPAKAANGKRRGR